MLSHSVLRTPHVAQNLSFIQVYEDDHMYLCRICQRRDTDASFVSRFAMAPQKDLAAARRIGLFDAHCHPTDNMSSTTQIAHMRAKAMTIMATRAQDQDLVLKTAEQYPIQTVEDFTTKDGKTQVVPAFGWHPWFAHQIYDDRHGEAGFDPKKHYRSVLTPAPDDDDDEFLTSLPSPRPLSKYLQQTEERLQHFPLALIGEVGLDRSFRVPYAAAAAHSETCGPRKEEPTPGLREGRRLTPYRVQLDHQRLILKAQLELAAKHRRAVSVHSVATHGAVFDVLQSLWKGHEKPSKSAQKKQKEDAANRRESEKENEEEQIMLPYPPRICMHSYSGPTDALKQFLASRIPADIFFSFSEAINFGSHNSDKAIEAIRAVPDDKILIETDLDCAGANMDRLLEDILERVCQIRGWSLEQGAKKLRANWERFIFGAQV